jgi:hypothetical protein
VRDGPCERAVDDDEDGAVVGAVEEEVEAHRREGQKGFAGWRRTTSCVCGVILCARVGSW